MREIRKRRTKPSGGQGPPYESRWPHFEAMTFICDSVLHRGLVTIICFNNRTHSNIGEGSTSQATNITQDGDDALPLLEATQVQDDILNDR